MVMIYVWLAVVCVSAIVEALTLQMAGIWFVVGGFVALIMAAVDVPLEWQIITCIIVSLVLLLSLRRLCLRFLLKKDNAKTNVDALVGSKVKLLEDVQNGESTARIGDVVWSVVIQDEQALKQGTTVIVEEVQGNKLVTRALSGVEQEIEKSGDTKVDGDVTVPAEDTATVEIERTTADIENATDTAEIKVPVTETENMTEQKETKRANTKTKKQTTTTKSKTSKK